MTINQPTASVTGRQGWKWTQEYAETTAENEAETQPAERQPRTSPEDATLSRPSYRELQQRVTQLEAQLEQKDQQLQYVVDHYERLLSEKNQMLTRQNQARDRTGPAGLVDLVREVTDR